MLAPLLLVHKLPDLTLDHLDNSQNLAGLNPLMSSHAISVAMSAIDLIRPSSLVLNSFTEQRNNSHSLYEEEKLAVDLPGAVNREVGIETEGTVHHRLNPALHLSSLVSIFFFRFIYVTRS